MRRRGDVPDMALATEPASYEDVVITSTQQWRTITGTRQVAAML